MIPRSEWLGKAHDQQGEKLQNGTLVEVRTRSKSKDIAYEFVSRGYAAQSISSYLVLAGRRAIHQEIVE